MPEEKRKSLLERVLARSSLPQGEEMTFAEYMERVFLKDPKRLSRPAHKYLVDAIRHFGVTEEGKYLYFEGKLFGVEEQLRELMTLLESAALGNDIRRRILLLLGPVGTAKSTTVYLIKRALEEYSRTEEGALYAISGCPLNEDPLHLLSPEARREIEQEFGLSPIEGDLCPVCAYRLKEEFGGDVSEVPVRRILLSESERVGIATFAPGDPNTQDISDLVGEYDYLALQKIGKGGHPLVWSFDGAAFQANRGVLEMIELYKAKRELLHALLTLAQERQVKPGRQSLVYVDTVILAHTNYTEFERFRREPGNEAIMDRTRVVEWKYTLSYLDEEKIYRLMIPRLEEHDVDPWGLRYPAIVSVLSRFTSPDDADFPAHIRLRLYAGEKVHGVSEYALATAKKKFEADGKHGISPRWMVDQITFLLTRKGYVATPDLILHLKEALTEVLDPKLVPMVLSVASDVYRDYVESLMSEVAVSDFDALAQDLFERYRKAARAYKTNERVYNPVTGEWEPPDTKFLESIESYLGITNPNEAASFRTDFLVYLGSLAESGKEISWKSHPKLEKAIRKKISEDNKPILRAALTTRGLTEEAERTYERILRRLISDHGYSERTAKALVSYYAALTRMA